VNVARQSQVGVKRANLPAVCLRSGCGTACGAGCGAHSVPQPAVVAAHTYKGVPADTRSRTGLDNDYKRNERIR